MSFFKNLGKRKGNKKGSNTSLNEEPADHDKKREKKHHGSKFNLLKRRSKSFEEPKYVVDVGKTEFDIQLDSYPKKAVEKQSNAELDKMAKYLKEERGYGGSGLSVAVEDHHDVSLPCLVENIVEGKPPPKMPDIRQEMNVEPLKAKDLNAFAPPEFSATHDVDDVALRFDNDEDDDDGLDNVSLDLPDKSIRFGNSTGGSADLNILSPSAVQNISAFSSLQAQSSNIPAYLEASSEEEDDDEDDADDEEYNSSQGFFNLQQPLQGNQSPVGNYGKKEGVSKEVYDEDDEYSSSQGFLSIQNPTLNNGIIGRQIAVAKNLENKDVDDDESKSAHNLVPNVHVPQNSAYVLAVNDEESEEDDDDDDDEDDDVVPTHNISHKHNVNMVATNISREIPTSNIAAARTNSPHSDYENLHKNVVAVHMSNELETSVLADTSFTSLESVPRENYLEENVVAVNISKELIPSDRTSTPDVSNVRYIPQNIVAANISDVASSPSMHSSPHIIDATSPDNLSEHNTSQDLVEFEEVLHSIDRVLESDSISVDTDIPRLKLEESSGEDDSEQDDNGLLTFTTAPSKVGIIGSEARIKTGLCQGNSEMVRPNSVIPDELQDKSVLVWSPDEVLYWCQSRGHDELAKCFADREDINGLCLLHIEDDDLVNLEIEDIGERSKILQDIEQLKLEYDINDTCINGFRDDEASEEEDGEPQNVVPEEECKSFSNPVEQQTIQAVFNSPENRQPGDVDGNFEKFEEGLSDADQVVVSLKEDMKRSKSNEGTLSSPGVEYAELEYRLASAESLLFSLQQQKSTILADMKRAQLDESIMGKKLSAGGNQTVMPSSNIYSLVKKEPKQIISVEVSSVSKDHHRFLVADHETNGLEVTCAEEGVALQKGDRLIEVNGHNIAVIDISDFHILMENLDGPYRLVVLRQMPKTEDKSQLKGLTQDLSLVMNDLTAALNENKELEHENEKLIERIDRLVWENKEHERKMQKANEQLVTAEAKWKKLHNILEDLKHENIDLDEYLENRYISDENKENIDLYRVAALIKALKKKMSDLNALEKKNHKRNNAPWKDIAVPYEELLDDNVPLWENLRTRNKDMVIQVLKDEITESHRQKIFLNRLLELVLKRAPHLMEDALNTPDNVSLSDFLNRPEQMV